ncbi:MAG: MOSC domain-containing protein [Cellvibrionaceae bacterium]
MTVDITQLFLFPVKSLRGIQVNAATLTNTGFMYDRYWMIVKPDGGFITQRQFPKMVLINTILTKDFLILSKDGIPDLFIPLQFQQKEPNSFTAKIWKDTCQVIDEGADASQWLSKAIGTPKPVRLVRMKRNTKRTQSKAHLLGDQTHTVFADAAPYLICNEASLHAVNNSLTKNGFDQVTMERFRPNIVIKGLAAFAEHNVKQLAHQHYQFKHCYPCQRCIIPTIDIETANRHPQQQPFTLISDLNAMPENPKAPAFGENAILEYGEDTILSVGDTLDVTQ